MLRQYFSCPLLSSIVFVLVLVPVADAYDDQQPTLIPVAELVPFVELREDFVRFGRAVAVDGATMVVGAPQMDTLADNTGAAFVYRRAAGRWFLQTMLLPSNGEAFDEFGSAVAVDGRTIVVGAPLHDGASGSDQGAAYVFALNDAGQWQEQAFLDAGDGGAIDKFGSSVAVNGDTVAIGAPRHSATAALAGAAYIFLRSGGVWSLQQKLEPISLEAADLFGSAVGLEGGTAVVGAPYDDETPSGNQGSAFVFVRSGMSWSEQQRITAGDAAANDHFATAVAISTDTILVGTWEDDHAGGDGAGSAYVFTRSGVTWSQQQKLVADDASAADGFGFSVDIDGDTAVVGAIQGDMPLSDGGSAYLFSRSGATWTQQREIPGVASGADLFGCSVAVSDGIAVVGSRETDTSGGIDAGVAVAWSNELGAWHAETTLTATQPLPKGSSGSSIEISGSTMAVGQLNPLDNLPSNAGAAHVFTKAFGVWYHEISFIGYFPMNPDNRFGQAVAVDGGTVAVGAPDDGLGGFSDAGFVRVFANDSGSWSVQQSTVRGTDTTQGDLFGTAVALDGDTMAIGAPEDEIGGPAVFSGSVYVFTRSGGTWTQQARLVAADAATGDEFGFSLALDGDTLIVGAPRDDHGGGPDAGSAYVFTRSGAVWTQQAKLVAGDTTPDDEFGVSLALDGDTLVAGSPNADHTRHGAGAAYVFTGSGASWVQEQKLAPSDPDDDDGFGNAVAIQGDLAVVAGSQNDPAGVPDAGSVYVFDRTGGIWTERAVLNAMNPTDIGRHGYAVAVDGWTIAAGAPMRQTYPYLGATRRTGATTVYEPAVEPGLIFEDDFESGATSSWSNVQP